MNREVLGYLGIKFEKREAYAVDYVSELLTMYKETTGLDETSFVSGRGHRKSIRQKQYEELHEYLERLKSYAYNIETCGEERNSYSCLLYTSPNISSCKHDQYLNTYDE